MLLNRTVIGVFFLFAAILSNISTARTVVRTHVTGWIPVYGLEKTTQTLDKNPHVLAGLTRVGLQFWNPSSDGKSVVFAPTNNVGELLRTEDVRRVVDLLKAHKIQVLLTVYNNSQIIQHWDWDWARRAFKDNPQDFITSLIVTMQEYGLDGIDLDLEGEGDFDVDRVAYAQFVKNLSAQLKLKKKILTVDSFHSPCANAPNMSWWRDWQGQIDAIHSMGYQDLYEGSSASFTPKNKSVCEDGAPIFKYSWQLAYGKKAGYRTDQILMGMPTWLDQWGEGGLGSSVSAHLQEAKALGVGIALWDLQLSATQWRSAQTWAEIQRLHGVKGKMKGQAKINLKTTLP